MNKTLLTDFHYELPPELIARYPLAERSASRLLCLTGANSPIEHKNFSDLPSLLNSKDLLICNDTRVIPARIFGQKPSGGQVEVLIERILDPQRCLAQLRVSKKPKPGSFLLFANNIQLEVIGRNEELFELKSHGHTSILEILESIGRIPLPPYLHRVDEDSDKERYQTIYARNKGSVAAPTAGLHFDAALFSAIQAKGVQIAFLTLHVGAGTFAPVREHDVTKHHMHGEYIEVSAELCAKIAATQTAGGRIIAVGTTTARALETASRHGHIQPFAGDTDIFIYPGYRFQCIDVLITNFHLPESTLLMLVCAFAGHAQVMAAYREAVAQQYRFFSYGDAMFVTRRNEA